MAQQQQQRIGGLNGNWPAVVMVVLTAASFMVGIRVGTLQAQASVAEKYLPVTRYTEDQRQILHKLDTLERKLDTLVRAVERNTARLERR